MNKPQTPNHHLLNVYSWVSSITLLLYGAIYYFFFHSISISLGGLIGGALSLFAPFVFRFTQSFSLSIFYLVVSGISVVVFAALQTGGTTSPVLFWLTSVPLVGGFLARKPWSTLKWFLFSVLCFFLLFIFEQIFKPIQNEIPEDRLRYVGYLAIFGITLFNGIFGQLFETELLKEKQKIEESKKAILRMQEELFHITSQVAHDIKSPLMALQLVSEDINELQEDKRLILKTAILRVHDIISSLSYHNFERRYAIQEPTRDSLAPVLLLPCIEEVVAEKNIQSRSKLRIEISSSFDDESHGTFLFCNERELRRMISNLIDNSFDAILEQGKVSVHVVSNGSSIQIIIEDNGKGISAETLGKLGSRGATFGKEGGSGLGLFHSKTQVEEWGGDLTIDSELHRGTRVKLTIPKAQPPRWFAESISLSDIKDLVIVDDDKSIHQVWLNRFSTFLSNPNSGQLRINHFFNPQEFKAWISSRQSSHETLLFLVDYEFPGSHITGLDLIRDYSLGKTAILVTGLENAKIKKISENEDVKILPKNLIRQVPICT